MATQHFHHALKVLEDVCTGCTHCMQVCPTEAIRVRNGIAKIINDKCVDCGECYNACPVSAIIVEQDDLQNIFKYKYRVALIPAVLIGQFPRNIPTKRIYSALLEEGFTHVYEAEHGCDIILKTHKNIQQKSEEKPLISTFCPAVIRLIQVKYPSLVDNIIPIKAPMDIASLSIKRMLKERGIPEKDIGVFYVTPCAAKIAAMKNPEGEDKSAIDGVINMDLMFNKLFTSISREDKNVCPIPEKHQLSHKSIMWSLSNGEAKHAEGRSLAIDGIHNIIEFLEKIENNNIGTFDFLELRACDQSCAGGILTSVNRFLIKERLTDRARRYKKNKKEGIVAVDKKDQATTKYLLKNVGVNKIKPRSIIKLDDNIEIAMQKMTKLRNLMCFLPGIDCGACGAPSCKALSEDIVQNYSNVSDCVFIQKTMQKNKKLSVEHSYALSEKIWGKNKFEKDCTKKGAKNENS